MSARMKLRLRALAALREARIALMCAATAAERSGNAEQAVELRDMVYRVQEMATLWETEGGEG